MNQVEIISLNKNSETFKKKIRGIIKKTTAYLKKEDIYLEIYLVSNKIMLNLNKKFRNKNKISDVLSFKEPKNFIYPPGKHKRKTDYLGEIYLNVPFIKNEVKKADLLDIRIKSLLVHAFLHLLGYTHEKNDDRIRMEKFEKKILSQI